MRYSGLLIYLGFVAQVVLLINMDSLPWYIVFAPILAFIAACEILLVYMLLVGIIHLFDKREPVQTEEDQIINDVIT